MIKISHLTKEYDLYTPLKDISIDVNDGDIISIIGASGSGKSTLLRCINMLEEPTSGSISIDDVEITDKANGNNQIRLKMGMVFQSFNLFSHMSVIENVMMPQIDNLHRSIQEAYDKAISVLRLVGMDGKAMQYPDALSGGQKQRVAIARTLAMDPEILLFDEPTSALDPTMVNEVESVIYNLSKLGKTMLIVTHEMSFARKICNRVWYLKDGTIYDDGTPEEIFDNPRKDETRRFVNRLKAFETLIEGKDYDYASNLTELTKYCFKNQIDHHIAHKIESCFEELCIQILLPRLNNPLISFVLEYSDANYLASISIQYNGDKFNPMESDNELSLSILQNIIKDYKHVIIDDGIYTNKFTFDISN